MMMMMTKKKKKKTVLPIETAPQPSSCLAEEDFQTKPETCSGECSQRIRGGDLRHKSAIGSSRKSACDSVHYSPKPKSYPLLSPLFMFHHSAVYCRIM